MQSIKLNVNSIVTESVTLKNNYTVKPFEIYS